MLNLSYKYNFCINCKFDLTIILYTKNVKNIFSYIRKVVSSIPLRTF